MQIRSVVFAIFLLLSILLLGIYWAGLHGGFFFDDLPNILAVEKLRLENLSIESIAASFSSGSSGPSGRPIAQLSFALNYYVSGFDPFAFKFVNLVIHLANGWLVFFLARRLIMSAQPSLGHISQLIASGVLTAAWLLHPIQLLPVLHVVQRMTSLSALFLLLAFLCHLRWRECVSYKGKLWLFVGWGIFWPLSFFSKETGILFPLFVLAWEVIVNKARNGCLDRFSRWFSIVVLAIIVLAGAYLVAPAGNWIWGGYTLRSFSLIERVLTEARVLWFYIGLIYFPRFEAFALFHDDIMVSTGVLIPGTTLPSLVGLIALVWFAWATRTKNVLVSFGIAWFLIGHLMESTILPLEIAHEHRNYLPTLGLLLALVAFLSSALELAGPIRTVSITLMTGMLSYFPLVTTLRAHEFGDEVRRTQIEAQHHRESSRAQHEAGRVLAGLEGSNISSSPAYSFAKAHYELAGELDPNFKMNWLGLIHLNCQAGLQVERSWIDELERRLRDTAFSPGDKTVLYSLKEMSIAHSICLERRDVDTLFAAAIANQRVSLGVRAMLHSWHADYLWLRAADLPAARAALDRSLALVPTNASNRLKWVQLRYLSGEYEQARKLLKVLRDERLSIGERKTLDELLSEIDMRESQTRPLQIEQ